MITPKILPITVCIILGSSLLVREADALVIQGSSAQLVEEADLIVEGTVSEMYPTADQVDNTNADQAKEHRIFEFGFNNIAMFEVEQIYKGVAKFQQSIKVFYGFGNSGPIQQLLPNHKYIFYLKKHPYKDGYVYMSKSSIEARIWFAQAHRSYEKVDYSQIIQLINAQISRKYMGSERKDPSIISPREEVNRTKQPISTSPYIE